MLEVHLENYKFHETLYKRNKNKMRTFMVRILNNYLKDTLIKLLLKDSEKDIQLFTKELIVYLEISHTT